MTKWRIAAAVAGALAALPPAGADAFPTEDDPAAAQADPDMVAGKKALEAKNWDAAIRAFSSAALRDTRNADVQSYLGFAHRKAGRLDEAFEHYGRALQLNPRHRGAHEYVREAYLMVGDLAKAEEHLAALRGICLLPCEELGDLEKEVGEYKASKGF
jgi:Flp pilus assembly protein TadD